MLSAPRRTFRTGRKRRGGRRRGRPQAIVGVASGRNAERKAGGSVGSRREASAKIWLFTAEGVFEGLRRGLIAQGVVAIKGGAFVIGREQRAAASGEGCERAEQEAGRSHRDRARDGMSARQKRTRGGAKVGHEVPVYTEGGGGGGSPVGGAGCRGALGARRPAGVSVRTPAR